MNERLATHLDDEFPRLMRDMQSGVYSGIRTMVPTGADAEDLTQEVFIRAYRALAGYPPEQIRQLNLRGWIWTIAMNLCRNAARTRSRRPRTVALDREAFSPVPGPEAAALALDDHDEWRERLATLPAPQRTGIVLHHVVGLTYAEIAEATGRAEGTVKSDVHRGITQLKEAYA